MSSDELRETHIEVGEHLWEQASCWWYDEVGVAATSNEVDMLDEIMRLRAALVAIQSEAHTFGDGCDCGSVYVRQLDRVWDVAHKALTEEASRG